MSKQSTTQNRFEEQTPTPKQREAAEAHLDRLVNIRITNHSRLLVVGENACGKSLFRQIIKIEGINKVQTFHASMQLRTASNPEMGALSAMTHDLPWLATSHSTLHTIKQVLDQTDRAITEKEKIGLCIDEPEIGLGYGAQRGLAQWLYPELNKRAPKLAHITVITHSPIFVEAAENWSFMDLSMTPCPNKKAWLARQYDPNYIIEPQAVLNQADTLFLTVRDRLNKKK